MARASKHIAADDSDPVETVAGTSIAADAGTPLPSASLELFTEFGQLRDDFKAAEIAALSDEQRFAWQALFSARLEEQAADAKLSLALRDLTGLMVAANTAQKLEADARPSPEVTRLKEVRRASWANSPQVYDRAEIEADRIEQDELESKLKPLIAAAIKAEERLDDGRKTIQQAKVEQRDARSAVALALNAWSAIAVNARPSADDVIRANIKRSQEHLLALATGAAKRPEKPRPASTLDAILQSGARGHSTRRGKLPSER